MHVCSSVYEKVLYTSDIMSDIKGLYVGHLSIICRTFCIISIHYFDVFLGHYVRRFGQIHRT